MFNASFATAPAKGFELVNFGIEDFDPDDLDASGTDRECCVEEELSRESGSSSSEESEDNTCFSKFCVLSANDASVSPSSDSALVKNNGIQR